MQKRICDKIGLISCVKAKEDSICEAKDMYTSPLFRYMYSYAKRRCRQVFILSAKYGLLNEKTVIKPYNVTLNSMSEEQKQRWSAKVMCQFKSRFNLDETHFLYLGGAKLYKISKDTAY